MREVECSKCKLLKPHHAKGMCRPCYHKKEDTKPYIKEQIICKKCNNVKKHYSRGYCLNCYNLMKDIGRSVMGTRIQTKVNPQDKLQLSKEIDEMIVKTKKKLFADIIKNPRKYLDRNNKGETK